MANIPVTGGLVGLPGPFALGAHKEDYHFWLGVPDGTAKPSLVYGYTISSVPAVVPPPATDSAPVTPNDYMLFSGLGGSPLAYKPATGKGKQGGSDAAATPVAHDGVSNQEAGDWECVPTAVSNSLKWLKKKHNLNINDNLISIQALRTALNWQPNYGCTLGAWQQAKSNYCTAKGIPVSTTKLPGAKVADAYTHFKNDCDVEIDVGGHCVTVVEMTANKDGTYTLKVNNDTKQGKSGGTTVETVTITDPATGLCSGPAWCNGEKIVNFTAECKT